MIGDVGHAYFKTEAEEVELALDLSFDLRSDALNKMAEPAYVPYHVT